MGLRCEPKQVAIYIPPQAVTSLPAGEALEQCRAFLGDLLGAAPPDVRVFDDRAADVRVTSGDFFDDIQGPMPALAALEAEATNDRLRVVLTAEVGKLYAVANDARWLADHVQVIEAARVLSRRPERATLAALHGGDASAWASFLKPLTGRRMRAPGERRSHVDAPAALATAFAEVDTLEGWCRVADRIAEDALPSAGRHMCAQAVRHFEEWLGSAIDALPRPPKKKRTTKKAAEAAYREHLTVARRALEEGRWDDVTDAAEAAHRIGLTLPPEIAGTGTTPKRLSAGAQLGRLRFAEALQEMKRLCAIDALCDVPWSPSEDVRIVVGVSDRESALRYAAWLCTRIASVANEEWRSALDGLSGYLEPGEAESLRAARAKKKPKAAR